MPWQDGALVLYHGTDHESANRIATGPIDWKYGDPLTDFGLGFYTTTSLHQARNWANTRCRRLRASKSPKQVYAVVLRFEVDRADLDGHTILCFVLENSNQDYWDFVRYCRQGHQYHGPKRSKNYDIVFG
jgi:hypothetical protein